MRRKNKSEVYPLLTTDWLGNPTYRQKPIARNIRQEDEESEPEMEDDDEVFDIIDSKKKRNVNMVWHDVFLLAMDYLQILALYQSMSLRWVWPKKWLTNTYFIFGFNIDIWEMSKFTSSDSYNSVQNYYTPSSTVNISWKMINYAWIAGVILLGVIYGSLHLGMKFFFYPNPRAKRFVSRVKYLYVVLIHILSLPLGVVLFRNFQCEENYNTVYTMNEYKCFSGSHWMFAGISLLLMTLIFIVYPAFLVWKIRREAMTGTSNGYLSHLLLKETEYKIHVNWSWLYDGMWLFSSYKQRGWFCRPLIQIVKLLYLVIFAAFFHNIEVQTIMLSVLSVLCFIMFCFIRPYRLTSCNMFLAFCYLSHLGTGFLSAMLAHYTVYTIPNAWLTPEYSIWFLVYIQAFWSFILLALLVYLASRTLCHSTKSCYKRPVWPNIVTSGQEQLTAETRKFMIAIIKAKIAYERIIRMPKMFAPVHELARHIHIINTFWREAEYLQDALHMILWEVLDDLVEQHAELSTKSLFADSVKKSIRRTAGEFMTMVPMFTQRLAQRDYDFILVNPVKKRLLLKMYIMGLFLNGRKEKVAKKKLLEPAVGKVWPPLPADHEYEEEDGYYEDLYPGPLQIGFTDDLLDVVVENSTDAESTEEEDNVDIMLKTLPHVDLVDLENPLAEEIEEEESDMPPPVFTPPFKPLGKGMKDMPPSRPLSGVSKAPTSRPSSAASKVSVQSDGAASGRESTHSNLFGSYASLRQDMGSVASVRPVQSPSQFRPTSAVSTQMGRIMSPLAQPSSSGVAQTRRSSEGSILSGGLSPLGQRSPGGGSVISLTPTLPDSQGSARSDQEMATVNPGYIPDEEETEGGATSKGDNLGFEPDQDQEAHVENETSHGKGQRKKSASRRGSKSSHVSSASKKKRKKSLH